MKVLSIDDREMDIKGIRDCCKENGWEFQWKTFDEDYYKVIMENDPDVVVLDWFDGLDQDKDEGNIIFNSIWENGYRPIVVFSGQADRIAIDNQMQESNLLQKIPKGDDEIITEYLRNNEAYFETLSDFRKKVGKTIISSVNAIEPLKRIEKEFVGKDKLEYILAKRMVNVFDLETLNIDLPEWGMYIYPPVSNSLQTGDVIRAIDSNAGLDEVAEADKYRVIISQSCDLAHSKTEAVVCLKCKSIEEGIFKSLKTKASCSIGKAKEIDKEGKKKISDLIIKNFLSSSMNAGFFQQWGILPELKGVCPDMSVDLKNVELVSFDKISKNFEASEGCQYYRVASIDAQYVSQLVWGYMQNSCRPGVPDRSVEEWAERILSGLIEE